jgi:hypothetical protein
MENWKKDLEELKKLDEDLNNRDIKVEKCLKEKFPLENDEDNNFDLEDLEIVDNDK